MEVINNFSDNTKNTNYETIAKIRKLQYEKYKSAFSIFTFGYIHGKLRRR